MGKIKAFHNGKSFIFAFVKPDSCKKYKVFEKNLKRVEKR